MNLSEKLRNARIAKHMSQTDLAEKVGVSLRTIQNYELGVRVPKSRSTYDKLAEALDMDVNILLDENAEFVLRASESYGGRGAKQAMEMVADSGRWSVLPAAIQKSVSPEKMYSSHIKHTEPGECPGVCITFMVLSPRVISLPSFKRISGFTALFKRNTQIQMIIGKKFHIILVNCYFSLSVCFFDYIICTVNMIEMSVSQKNILNIIVPNFGYNII